MSQDLNEEESSAGFLGRAENDDTSAAPDDPSKALPQPLFECSDDLFSEQDGQEGGRGSDHNLCPHR